MHTWRRILGFIQTFNFFFFYFFFFELTVYYLLLEVFLEHKATISYEAADVCFSLDMSIWFGKFF